MAEEIRQGQKDLGLRRNQTIREASSLQGARPSARDTGPCVWTQWKLLQQIWIKTAPNPSSACISAGNREGLGQLCWNGVTWDSRSPGGLISYYRKKQNRIFFYRSHKPPHLCPVAPTESSHSGDGGSLHCNVDVFDW